MRLLLPTMLVGILVSLCAVQLVTLQTLTGRLSSLEQFLPQATTAANAQSQLVAATRLPEKFLLDGNTPSSDQMNRGDCYLFSMSGILEDSYRRYGVSKGWMNPEEYVRLSRQALGIDLMEICKKQPNVYCPAETINGKPVFARTVEGAAGADVDLVFWLRNLGDQGALPAAVCAYCPESDAQCERVCPGLPDARASNPLQFTVHSQKAFWDKEGIKKALVQNRKPLALATSEVSMPYYLPCDEQYGPSYGCDPKTAQCVPCPLDRVYRDVKCCILSLQATNNMKGEWNTPKSEPLVIAGGHAINIVGYSDTYVTEQGDVGGFIIRNTWADGVNVAHGAKSRGSHTPAFFMHEVSFLEESVACPNPHSPRSWGICASLEDCSQASANSFTLRSQLQPRRLSCRDGGESLPVGSCDKGSDYFMMNQTAWGISGLYITCFIRKASSGASEVCLPPLTLEDVATVITPADIDTLPQNMKENGCGFNFIPYRTFDRTAAFYPRDVEAHLFDITWAESSYLSRAFQFAKKNYTLLKQSTHKLPTMTAWIPAKY